MKVSFNQGVFFASTISLKISDAQIEKHLRDQRVRQLKDVRTSLYLRFNAKRSAGTWWFYRYEGGKQYPYRIGTYPATSAKDIMSLVSAATITIAQDKAVSCNRFETVDQLIEWHVLREVKKKNSSKERLNNLRSMSNRHLIGIFHGEPVETLNHEIIDENLVQEMFNEGYSVSYVKALFSLLKAAFSSAKRLKHITSNPLSEIKFKNFFPDNFSLTKAQVRGCRVNSEQIKGILEDCAKQPPKIRMLVLMLLGHGARIGETRKAKWKNISFSLNHWVIPSTDTKSGVEMIYPLSDPMAALLLSYRNWQKSKGYSGDYVFPISFHQNKPAYGSLASQWVRQVSKREWSAHDLRKRAKSVWLEIGIDYIICESLLNHAKDKLDQVYMHSHIEDLKKTAINDYHLHLKSRWSSCLTPVSL